MKSNRVIPIVQLGSRMPEAGRIRLGVKAKTSSGKERPASISEFRFTTRMRDLADQVAGNFGGVVTAWNDQWQVLSTSTEIPVLLLPDGISTNYELWSGGGCLRRCDGEMCESPQKTGDGDYELVEEPCVCLRQNLRQCEPYTRLQVVLPDLAFGGSWRLETKGWNAAEELPGMYGMITELAERGQMVRAILGVAKREKMTAAGKRNFVVPYLRIEQNVHELMAGAASITAISAAGSASSVPALPRGDIQGTNTAPEPEIDTESRCTTCGEMQTSPSSRWCSDPFHLHRREDDIADAELVDDDLLEIEAMLKADASNFGLDGDRYVEAISRMAVGDRDKMRENSRKVHAGLIVPLGFSAAGVQFGKGKA